MRTVILGLLLAALAAPCSAALEVDATLVSSGTITQEHKTPLSADMLVKMTAVDQRRTAFAKSFEWGAPEEYTLRQKAYSTGMDAFARESEELKLEWHLSIGNNVEAERIAEHLRNTDAKRHGEDLHLERRDSTTNPVLQDGGKR